MASKSWIGIEKNFKFIKFVFVFVSNMFNKKIFFLLIIEKNDLIFRKEFDDIREKSLDTKIYKIEKERLKKLN